MFALPIFAANWLIGHVGTTCVVPQGPCVVPVAPALMAPSGVMMAGVALVLRDLVQRRLRTAISALAVVFGSALSALLTGIACGGFGNGFFALGIRRSCGLCAAGAAAACRGRHCFELGRLGGRFHRVLMACVRLTRLSGWASGGQGMDDAVVGSVRGLAAAPRSEAWYQAGMNIEGSR